MNKDLEQNLARLCPNLYKDLYGDKFKTCMRWGLVVGNGWYPLLEELSLKLEAMIVALPEDSPLREIRAAQIKEKFGGLRFYLTGGNYPEMDNLISEAEALSFKICEICGGIAERRGGGWIKTLCEVCYLENENKKKESYIEYGKNKLG